MAPTTNRIIRELGTKLREASTDATDRAVEEMLDYFDRSGDLRQVANLIKRRYCVGVRRVGSDTDQWGTWERYERGKDAAVVDAGIYEIVGTGIGCRIASAIATLFDQPDQRWGITSGADTGDVRSAWLDARSEGGGNRALTRADYLASAIGSAVVWVGWQGGLRYRALPPTSVHVVFGGDVVDGDVRRGPDTTDIDDAHHVVILMSESEDDSKNLWRCYVGRSEDYPDGRMVDYRASDWRDVPLPGAKSIVSEYRVGDGVANPLTIAGAKHEYPIAIIRGSSALDEDDILPISASLHQSCVEIDLAWSRVLRDASQAAHGDRVFTNSSGGRLPPIGEGVITLEAGQTLQVVGKSASEAVSTVDVIRSVIEAVASGYGVPAYQISTGGAASQDVSGVSLAIQAQPLQRYRDGRIEVNTRSVRRLCEIEWAFLREWGGVAIPDDAVLEWSAGTVQPIRVGKDWVDELVALRAAGLISHVEAVRRAWNLPSDDEAAQKIVDMAEHDRLAPAPRPARGPLGVL